MSESVIVQPDPVTSKPGRLMRRGLLAGTAALVAGLMGKVAPHAAEAANGEPVILGQTNDATAETTIRNPNSAALQGISSAGAALVGVSGGNAGVFGTTGSASGGVVGSNSGSGPAVVGNSTGGIGVSGFAGGSIAVAGSAISGTGVYGTTGGANGFGVIGLSGSAIGVRGLSSSNVGVYGTSDSSIATLGISGTSIGIYGRSSSGFAGQFDGSVRINGNFEATGIKSAVVINSDGDSKRLYCLEAPESWFEDYGSAQLAKGYAEITIRRDFLSVVNTGEEYHVFLTPYGDCNGLAVTTRNQGSFVVRELQSGASGVVFSYRIVAKRRDIESSRLESVSGGERRDVRDLSERIPDAPRAPRLPDVPRRP